MVIVFCLRLEIKGSDDTERKWMMSSLVVTGLSFRVLNSLHYLTSLFLASWDCSDNSPMGIESDFIIAAP